MTTPAERDYYARRAIEVRGYASAAQDAEIRQTLERMAASYDKLVEDADHMFSRLRAAKRD